MPIEMLHLLTARTRFIAAALVVIALLGTGAAWLWERDRRIAQTALLEERSKQAAREVAEVKVTYEKTLAGLRLVAARTDTVRDTVEVRIAQWRERPAPATRVESVYVRAGDELAAGCSLLARTCGEERAAATLALLAADSVALAQELQIEALLREIAQESGAPRLGPIRVGLGAGYGLYYDMSRRAFGYGPGLTAGITISF